MSVKSLAMIYHYFYFNFLDLFILLSNIIHMLIFLLL